MGAQTNQSAMLSCYSVTGKRKFERTEVTELNHLIHRKLPHPTPGQFFIIPLLSSFLTLSYFQLPCI